MKEILFKKSSTLFLKLALVVMALAALAVFVFALPSIAQDARRIVDLDLRYPVYALIAGCYLTAIPFFIALYQAFNLLRYIDENKAFSELSVKALSNIKYSAIMIAIVYGASTPLLIPIAEADDAPGVMGIGLIMTGAALVVAVFAAVLQKLVKNAIEIKSENDLTV